jgi:hypothetical protein
MTFFVNETVNILPLVHDGAEGPLSFDTLIGTEPADQVLSLCQVARTRFVHPVAK